MTTETKAGVLQGLRVLVVEDSFLIAWSLRKTLNDMGCEVVGPASSVEGAMKLIEEEECDAGILDINLGSETSIDIAAALTDQGKPFLFVTGYSSPALLEVKYQHHRRLRKPLSESTLKAAILEEFGAEEKK